MTLADLLTLNALPLCVHVSNVGAGTISCASAADAVSASRPGARRETLERYIKRLEKLEDISSGFQGVENCYAIQAGREIRVIVNADNVDDASAMKIARDIAKKIEEEMTYPGEIKVTLLREVRCVEYAR